MHLFTDITIKDKKYHVQTEDWGPAKLFLVSRVFVGGAVLKTVKTPYEEALRGGPVNDAQAIARAMKIQHTRVLDSLK